ncbi:MAG: ATP-binding protein [Acidobacteriota bacterium]
MNLLDAIALAGFFLGVLLHLFLLSAFLKRRRKSTFELVLLFLIGALLVWFSGNFLAVLMRAMEQARLAGVLRAVNAVTFVTLGLLPPLLFHTHWIYYRKRHSPAPWERKLIWLLLGVLYLALAGLPLAVRRILAAPPTDPLRGLFPFDLGFLVLLSLAYYGSAFIGYRIVTYPRSSVERAVFRGLALIFAFIPLYNVLVVSASESRSWLMLGVWLASLLPSSLICYHIYRYQFLDVDTTRPLASALMILLTLSVYILAVRLIGGYLEGELGTARSPSLLLEATLLVGILLLFPTLSRGLETLAARLFSGEIRKYREIGEVIHRTAPILANPDLYKEFVEDHLKHELGTSRVRINLNPAASPQLTDQAYPLVAADRRLGYLEISQPQTDSRSEREAMHFLANEIAVGLDRCHSLATQVRMERELAQKSHMEEIGRMAAAVAHNVKNPLSSMRTLLQLLQEADNLTSDQRDEVRMMLREIDRLSSTVTNLLKFSRFESIQKGRSGEWPGVSLSVLADSLQEVFAGDLQARRIRLDVAGSDLTIRTDPEILTDILSNLLLNAIEASPAGGTVRVSFERDGGQAELTVEDEGPGIPEQVRGRLFEPFVSTKSRGTGLGLAIVKKRVDQLSGTVSYVSPVRGRGTRFTVRLPIPGDYQEDRTDRLDPSQKARTYENTDRR